MKEIELNIKVHANIVETYEQIHGEIFNPLEQERLHQQLQRAVDCIETSSGFKEALDYGCGSGNLTKHLLDLGLAVTAADVSDKFLALVREKYGAQGKLSTLQINGQDLSNVEDNRFDLVATYSVLHHIPDYLQTVKELIRVTKPGGIIYLDHEASESFWNKTKEYQEFLAALPQVKKSWKRFFKISNYSNKIRRMFNPRYEPEGDIHVWGDDHIEWKKVEDILHKNNCKIIHKEDYLLYKRNYPIELYKRFQMKCVDMCVLVAQKC